MTPFNTDIFFTPSPSYQLFIDLVPHIPRYASYNSNKSFVSSNLIMHSDLCFSLDYVVRFSSFFCFSVRRFAGSFANKSLFVSVCCYVHFHCNLQLFLYTFFSFCSALIDISAITTKMLTAQSLLDFLERKQLFTVTLLDSLLLLFIVLLICAPHASAIDLAFSWRNIVTSCHPVRQWQLAAAINSHLAFFGLLYKHLYIQTDIFSDSSMQTSSP